MMHSMLKGLQCIIGQFQIWSAIGKFSNVRESFAASIGNGWMTSFLILNILEAKDTMSEKMTIIHHQHGEMYW